ncbi:hypothetical protein F5Y14DRAFT_382316 [Nemania sp. NC0429]|nr:hypothetical protein F5Y14DRAFT_382316 [Nemania sp. NC0429]
MRFTLPIALYAIAASASALPATPNAVASRDGSSAPVWYVLTERANCGSFYCSINYYVFGPANTVPGAPVFAARCLTYGGCTNTVPGSDIQANPPLATPGSTITLTQTFLSGGKNVTLTGTANWDASTDAAFTVKVSPTTA